MGEERAVDRGLLTRGAVTVEAALVMPIVVWVLCGILDLFFVMGIQWRITRSMEQAGDLLLVCATCQEHPLYDGAQKEGIMADGEKAEGKSGLQARLLSLAAQSQKFGDPANYPAFVSAYVLAELSSIAPHCRIAGGLLGLHFKEGPRSGEDGGIDVLVEYTARLSIWPFHSGDIPIRLRLYRGMWQGRGPDDKEKGEDDRTVYVTRYGTVYHLYRDCRHLDHEICQVLAGDLPALRNKEGRKYYPCEICVRGRIHGLVLVTMGGASYHHTAVCPALVRYIEEISLSLTAGKPCCRVCQARREKEAQSKEE